MDIYEPAEDSYLLARYVEKYAKKSSAVLDIGCGSGIQTETALKKTSKVIGVDINPRAVEHCKKSRYTSKAKFIQSNLFQKVPKQGFDLIIFNPPYLPDSKDPKEIKDYTTGGKHGYEIIERFLSQCNLFLKDSGMILIVFSSLTKKHMVDQFIRDNLFEHKLLEEKSIFFEKIYCYKLTKSSFLIKLNKLKVAEPRYFTRGKRGFIYKGVYNKKEAVIKVHNTKSDRIGTIEREADMLRLVNELDIGPKLYYSDKSMAIIEYIEGPFILDYLEKATKPNRKKVLLDMLDQMHKLDKNKLEKLEMTRPLRHIIVRNNKPILIDFERMRKTPYPKNVTQYIQFLCRLKEHIKIDKSKIIKLGKEYTISYDMTDLKKYLNMIL